MRPHGRARVDPSNPQAFGICDGCSFTFNLVDLHYQMQWAGPQLINTQRRKCSRCLDVPQPQLRPVIPGPDPVPVADPRPDTGGGGGAGGGAVIGTPEGEAFIFDGNLILAE